MAVGVLHAAEPSDYIVTTYREHVHAIVPGITPGRLMAELFGMAEATLSCDHRLVFGADGARFLTTVATLLKQPEAL